MASAITDTVKAAVNTAVSTATAAASTVTGAAPTSDEPAGNQGSVDQSDVISPHGKDVKNLERKLSLRPDRSELVDRNILKNPNVAPSLQAAQADLARAQLENKLENALQHRPSPDELVKEGILTKDEIPTA